MAKILLVEDDNNLREIYGARLGAEGYEIVSAPDGEEALAVAVKEKPDLIISDIMMPKVSGFDMLDILRNAPETKDTKIIMMTALSQAEDKERADKLGADLYLVKSQVTLEDVAAAVHKILNEESQAAPAEPAPAQADAAAPAPEPQPTPQPPADPVPQPPAPASPTEAPSPVTPAPEPPVEPPKEPVVSVSEPPAPASVPAPVPTSPASVTPSPAASPTPAPDDSASATVPTPPATTPAEPPKTDEPAAQAPTTAPVEPPEDKPAAKKIEVVLPDDKEEQKEEPQKEPAAEAPVETPAAADTAQQPATKEEEDDVSSIGPNLAEALADEEKNSPLQVEAPPKTEDTPKPAEEAVDTSPSSVIKPQEATAAISEEKNEPEDQSPAADSTPTLGGDGSIGGKKVIQPINDPTKGPDLETLLAKEEAMEGLPTPNPSSTVEPPAEQTDSTPEKPQAPPENSDDLSKISL